MLGDEGKNPTPTTIDGLAAMMTKILGRLGRLDVIDERHQGAPGGVGVAARADLHRALLLRDAG